MEEKKLYNAVRKIITLADGRQIEIETGKLAKQADGSVVVKMGDTMLLGTVVAAKDAKEGTDFMPLQVEYKEKFASCGRFPGGFMKREGKASDAEVLVARLIDRALRPLFPADYHAEVFVTVNLISADKDIQPDALAGLAASAALAVSDIPFGGPISEVRVARIGGEFVINLTTKDMAFATDWCGVRSGRDYHKFDEMKLTPGQCTVVSAPLIEESPLCIECRVKEIVSLGSHDMFIADVVNVRADDRNLNPETGKLELAEANPLVYVHGGYYGLGEKIGKFGWSVEKKKS